MWDLWVGNVPVKAAGQARDLPARRVLLCTWEARANYGFLDGHAESLRFREAFTDMEHNRFDPAVAP